MGRLAVIGGTSTRGTAFDASGELVQMRGVGERDPVFLHDAGDHLILQRHGYDEHIPPHRINHVDHALALRDAGVDRVLALASVGSLRLDWPVGTVACPEDFYAPQATPSIYDVIDKAVLGHSVPGFDLDWRTTIVDAWDEHATSPIVDGGVYAETPGPRFETPAEVRMLAQIADLVGMTIASESIVTKEAGIAYAAVCVVDNLANGLASEPLTMAEFYAGVQANRARLLADLDIVLPVLAERPR